MVEIPTTQATLTGSNPVEPGPPPLETSIGEVPTGYVPMQVPAMQMMTIFVPEGTQVARGGDGLLYHAIERVPEAIGAAKVWQWRPLAATLEEAREKRWDFYHPRLGLIWNGFKLARDRTPQDIMADGSIGGLVPPGELPVQRAGYAPDAEPAHT